MRAITNSTLRLSGGMKYNVFNVFFFIDISTLDSYQAIFLPLGASLSLLIMFLFFDSLQLVFAVCTAGMFYYISDATR